MAGFYVYSTSSGVIRRWGRCQDGLEAAQAQAGEVGVTDATGVTGDTHYVALGPPAAAVLKAAMGASIDRTRIAADGVDAATISSIPVGAIASIAGLPSQTVNDGVLEFASAEFVATTISLSHRSRLAQSFEVESGIARAGVALTSVVAYHAARVGSLVASASSTLIATALRLMAAGRPASLTSVLAPAPARMYTVSRVTAVTTATPAAKSSVAGRVETASMVAAAIAARLVVASLPITAASAIGD